jgi:hypothetical protein
MHNKRIGRDRDEVLKIEVCLFILIPGRCRGCSLSIYSGPVLPLLLLGVSRLAVTATDALFVVTVHLVAGADLHLAVEAVTTLLARMTDESGMSIDGNAPAAGLPTIAKEMAIAR